MADAQGRSGILSASRERRPSLIEAVRKPLLLWAVQRGVATPPSSSQEDGHDAVQRGVATTPSSSQEDGHDAVQRATANIPERSEPRSGQ